MYFSATQSNFEAYQYQTNGFQGNYGLPANPTLPNMPCAPSHGNMNAQANYFGQLMQTQQGLFSGWSNFCGCPPQQMPQGPSYGNNCSPQGPSYGNNCYPQLPQTPQVPGWPQYGSYPQQPNCYPQMPALPPVPGWPSYGSYPQGQCQYPQLPPLPQMPEGPTCFGSPYPQMPPQQCLPPEVHIHNHYYNEQPVAQPAAQPAAPAERWRTPAPTPLTRSLPSPPPAATTPSAPFVPAAPANALSQRRGTFAAHSYGAFGPGTNTQAVFNAAYFNNAQGGQALMMDRG